MAKIQKSLFDLLLKRQINIGRYGEKKVRDILSLLNAADREILAKIAERGETKSFTGARLKRFLKEIRSMIDATYGELHGTLQEEMLDFAEHSAEFAGSALASQLPVKWSPVSLSKEQLLAIVDDTPIAIGPEKRLLLEEIFQSMAAHKEEAIRGALRLGMVQGETVPEMIQRLRGTRAEQYRDGLLEGSRRSMSGIVRSVIQATNNNAVQAVYDKNSEVLNGWVYVATLDSRTCSVCFSKSGKQFDLGEGPLPILHVNCRCFQAPAIKSWEEPEFGKFQRASKGGPVDADISFNDWLKGQDYDTQVELLGPARAKLFSDGKLTLDKFTDASGKLLSLDDLKQRIKPPSTVVDYSNLKTMPSYIDGVPIYKERHKGKRFIAMGNKVRISLNTSSPAWKDMEGCVEKYHKDGWFSSPDKNHVIYHELGHVLSKRKISNDKDAYLKNLNAFSNGFFKKIASKVSRYAATNGHEFVAEVYAAKRAGVELDEDVLKYFEFILGVEI